MNTEFFQELGEAGKRGHVAKEKTMTTRSLYMYMFSASYKNHLTARSNLRSLQKVVGAGVDKYIKRQRARDTWTALTSEYTPISAAQITHYAFSLPFSLSLRTAWGGAAAAARNVRALNVSGLQSGACITHACYIEGGKLQVHPGCLQRPLQSPLWRGEEGCEDCVFPD